MLSVEGILQVMGDTKPAKYNFEKMKSAATSDNPSIRKAVFLEYFERFGEFPSYLFENEGAVDARLQRTIDDLRKDPTTTTAIQKGIDALLLRLPS